MNKEVENVIRHLTKLGISYTSYEHPPAPTIEEALLYWKKINARHCKNLFFRNHKGNRHYLVILDHRYTLDIHDLEKRLKQGKLSFASEKRMVKYLGVKAGSVSAFGLINDREKHVHVFVDKNLQSAEKISFHPNNNSYTFVIDYKDFLKFLENAGNSFEFLDLYD